MMSINQQPTNQSINQSISPPIEDERKLAGYEVVIEDPEELSRES